MLKLFSDLPSAEPIIHIVEANIAYLSILVTNPSTSAEDDEIVWILEFQRDEKQAFRIGSPRSTGAIVLNFIGGKHFFGRHYPGDLCSIRIERRGGRERPLTQVVPEFLMSQKKFKLQPQDNG